MLCRIYLGARTSHCKQRLLCATYVLLMYVCMLFRSQILTHSAAETPEPPGPCANPIINPPGRGGLFTVWSTYNTMRHVRLPPKKQQAYVQHIMYIRFGTVIRRRSTLPIPDDLQASLPPRRRYGRGVSSFFTSAKTRRAKPPKYVSSFFSCAAVDN